MSQRIKRKKAINVTLSRSNNAIGPKCPNHELRRLSKRRHTWIIRTLLLNKPTNNTIFQRRIPKWGRHHTRNPVRPCRREASAFIAQKLNTNVLLNIRSNKMSKLDRPRVRSSITYQAPKNYKRTATIPTPALALGASISRAFQAARKHPFRHAWPPRCQRQTDTGRNAFANSSGGGRVHTVGYIAL